MEKVESLISIRLFGITKEFAGSGDFQMPIALPLSVREFKMELIKAIPELHQLSTYAIAVNGSYANDDKIIENERDHVAVIPPVSGG